MDGVRTYQSTKRALPKIYDQICDGGVILIDDVKNNSNYDGAYHAYMEFCKDRDIPPQIIGNKCGVIRKSGTVVFPSPL